MNISLNINEINEFISDLPVNLHKGDDGKILVKAPLDFEIIPTIDDEKILLEFNWETRVYKKILSLANRIASSFDKDITSIIEDKTEGLLKRLSRTEMVLSIPEVCKKYEIPLDIKVSELEINDNQISIKTSLKKASS